MSVLKQNKKIATATHNIMAYRWVKNGPWYSYLIQSTIVQDIPQRERYLPTRL